MSLDSDLALRATLDYSGVSQGFDAIISKSGQLSSGLSGQLSKGRGDFKSIGATFGQDLVSGMGAQFGAAGNAATGLATALGPVGIAAGVAGAALIGLGAASVQAASAWESSMAGVAKTTGLQGEELNKLSSDLLTLSTNMPIAASELASIAEAGGSLGIAKEELAGFTKVAAEMGVGFGMAADEAATAGAKILNAFGQKMDASNLEKLGSVVNAMGDSFAATEPQVLDFLNRASFLNTTMGQSIQQVSALGTTLISAGMSSETAATGLKSFLNMATSTTSKTGGMDNWAKLMGTSVDELKTKLGSDLNSTLIDTANKIAAIEDPVQRFQTAVALAGTEGAPALLKLAGQQENYTKALGMTNKEWEEANSLQKTYDAQAGTLNSQWQIFTNTISLAATELGTVLLPVVTSGIEVLTSITQSAIDTAEAIKNLVDEWNKWITGDVSDSAAIEKEYENKMGGHYELIGDDSVWIADQGAEAAETFKNAAQAATNNDPLGLNDPAVQQAAKDAGVDLGQLTGESAADSAATSFDTAFWSNIEQLQSQGIQSGKADSLGNAIKEYYGAGGTGALITATHGRNSKETDKEIRNFEYLGEQFEMIIREHTGSAVGDWSDWSLKAGDTFLVKNQFAGKVDPVASFEAATGLAAPEEGTEAYYLLLGDTVAAEKAKLQAQLNQDKFVASYDFDIEKVTDLAGEAKGAMRTMFEAVYAGAESDDAAEQAVAEAAATFGDKLATVDWANLDGLITAGKEIAAAKGEMYSGYGDMSWADVIDAEIAAYKDKLISGVSDLAAFTKTKASEMKSSIGDVFSDSFVSEDERSLITALEPQLELLKAEAPEEFEAAGLDSILAFVEAVKDGKSASELQAYAKELGLSFGESFKDSMTGTEYTAGETRSLADVLKSGVEGISDWKSWSENEFQTALKTSFDEMHEIQDRGYTKDIAQTEEWIKDKISLLDDYSDAFTDDQVELLSKWENRLITTKQFYDEWAETVDEGAKTVYDTVEYNDELFYGSVADSEKTWLDYRNEYGGYIGPTDSRYVDYVKNTKTDRVAEAEETIEELKSLGWEGVGVGSINVAFEATADTTAAHLSATELVSYIESSDPTMTVLLDTSVADARFANLYNLIVNSDPTMQIQVSVDAYQIRSAVQSAIAEAIASA